MTGRKNTSHNFKAERARLAIVPLFSICFQWPFDMHNPISLSKAPWHRWSADVPIGRQTESSSLPPTLIRTLKWWDVAKQMHGGTHPFEAARLQKDLDKVSEKNKSVPLLLIIFYRQFERGGSMRNSNLWDQSVTVTNQFKDLLR